MWKCRMRMTPMAWFCRPREPQQILSTESCQASSCQLGSLINAQFHCRRVVLPAAISSAMLMCSNTTLENQCWINVEWLLGNCRMRGRNPAPGDSIFWNLSQQAGSLLHGAAVLPEHIQRREGRTHLCSSPLPTPSQDVSKSKLKSKQSHEKHFNGTAEMQWPSDAVMALQKEQSVKKGKGYIHYN